MNFAFNNTEFKKVLQDFSSKIGLNISYQSDIIPKIKISGSYIDIPARKILQDILEERGLSYRVLLSDQIIVEKSIVKNIDHILSGRVQDSTTLEYIEGALIIDLLTGHAVYSNEYGFFSIHSKNEQLKLKISYLGYKDQYLQVDLSDNQYFNVKMITNNLLPEITIRSNVLGANESDGVFLTKEDIKAVAAVLGEFDVVRAVQTQAGVSSGADGFGGMHVRGGAYDQNLVLMDDVPLYYSSHAIGLLSMFNSDAIRSVKFFKEKIPTHYQSKLSSVLDVHHQDGNQSVWNIDGGLGILSSKLMLSGPVVKDKITLLLGARRTNLDPFLKEVTSYFNQLNGKEGNSKYYFYDINAKLGFDIFKKDKFYLSYYRGKDFYNDDYVQLIPQNNTISTIREFQNLTWNNQLISLRHQRDFSKKLFVKNVLYSSNYVSKLSEIDAIKFFNGQVVSDSGLLGKVTNSKIEEYSLNSTFDYLVNKYNTLKFGAAYSSTRFLPSIFSYSETDIDVQDILNFPKEVNDTISKNNVSIASEAALFLEDKMYFNDFISAKFGLRAAYLTGRGIKDYVLSPRFSFNVKADKNWTLSFAYDRLYQNSHLISTNSLSLPTDIWISSSKILKPQSSNQYSFSLMYNVSEKWEWLTTFYFKKMDHLVHVKEGAIFEFNNGVIEEQFVIGEGKSQGLEMSLRGKPNRHISFYINYAFQKSVRNFDQLNKGEQFYYKYDRPHQLKLGSQLNLTSDFGISYSLEYASGNPISLPLGQYPYFTIDPDKANIKLLAFDEINNIRLPYIFRMDCSVFYKIQKTWGFQELSFGIYNILNRKNPQFIDLVIDPFNPAKLKYEQVSLLPILPSLSYRIHWKSK
jgi:outer membrane receptor for ferrienterochelin and colicin